MFILITHWEREIQHRCMEHCGHYDYAPTSASGPIYNAVGKAHNHSMCFSLRGYRSPTACLCKDCSNKQSALKRTDTSANTAFYLTVFFNISIQNITQISYRFTWNPNLNTTELSYWTNGLDLCLQHVNNKKNQWSDHINWKWTGN